MKISIFLGITIGLLLLALPAAASDSTLGVFGNANEDDTINMHDVTYTERIILEYRDATDLADAKYDGRINMQDVTQIELIILGDENELTFTDRRGKAVTVKEPVKRAIVGSTATYELMRAINAQDKLVGICKYKLNRLYFPELNESISIGGRPPDYEKIIALDPDLVIAGSPTCSLGDEFAKTLEDIDIPFAMPVNPTPENLNEMEIIKMGHIFNRIDEAKYYTGFLNDSLDYLAEMTADIPEDDMPDVYIEAMKDYRACGNTSFQNMICEIAGGKNIARNTIPDRYAEVDPEWIVEHNPDIIIKIIYYRKSGYETDDCLNMKAVRDDILNRSELSNVKAVKNGHVYVLSSSLTYGYSFVNAIPYIMKVFHPDRFSDLDPTEIHQKYVDFQGLDFDVEKQGVFIYPPLEGV